MTWSRSSVGFWPWTGSLSYIATLYLVTWFNTRKRSISYLPLFCFFVGRRVRFQELQVYILYSRLACQGCPIIGAGCHLTSSVIWSVELPSTHWSNQLLKSTFFVWLSSVIFTPFPVLRYLTVWKMKKKYCFLSPQEVNFVARFRQQKKIVHSFGYITKWGWNGHNPETIYSVCQSTLLMKIIHIHASVVLSMVEGIANRNCTI